jgi:hypothetical protein
MKLNLMWLAKNRVSRCAGIVRGTLIASLVIAGGAALADEPDHREPITVIGIKPIFVDDSPIGGGFGIEPGRGGGGGEYAGWTDQKDPRCANEADVLKETMDSLDQGKPPGDIIMDPIKNGPFLDPAFSSPGWLKYNNNVILRVTDTPNRTVTRYSVHIHYMYNTITKTADQIRIKSTFDSGCKGKVSAIT